MENTQKPRVKPPKPADDLLGWCMANNTMQELRESVKFGKALLETTPEELEELMIDIDPSFRAIESYLVGMTFRSMFPEKYKVFTKDTGSDGLGESA